MASFLRLSTLPKTNLFPTFLLLFFPHQLYLTLFSFIFFFLLFFLIHTRLLWFVLSSWFLHYPLLNFNTSSSSSSLLWVYHSITFLHLLSVVQYQCLFSNSHSQISHHKFFFFFFVSYTGTFVHLFSFSFFPFWGL